MEFKAYGPFAVPMQIELKAEALGKVFENARTGLQDSGGIYVFINTKLRSPVYIGMAHKNSFITRIASHLNGPKNSGLKAFLDCAEDGVGLLLIAFESDDKTLHKAELLRDEDRQLIADKERFMITVLNMINPDITNVAHRYSAHS